jgi:DNA-binding transcriptional MerR regulator
MTDLIKASDVSNRYGVSTRTLRYYEEIGLNQSRRTTDYAYRLYDEANIKRLEQILILRKLNISIKDIRWIFNAAGSEVVLEENDIDIDSIIQIVTHAVIITDHKSLDYFISCYENEILSRDISEDEKEKLIHKVNEVWGKGKPENPRGAAPYGVKQFILDDYSTVEKTADMVAECFGLA